MYTPEQVAKAKEIIIENIANGKSLKKTLEEDNTLPSRPIVYQWLNENHKDYDQEFLNNYTRAREDSADLDVEKAEDIIDKVEEGELDHKQARVMLDGLKWLSGIKQPKKYGPKLDITSKGARVNLPVIEWSKPEQEDEVS
jgi:hypothetical protein